jgi:hypothetical protein
MPRVVPDRLAQEPHEGRASWTLKVLSCFADSPPGWDPDRRRLGPYPCLRMIHPARRSNIRGRRVVFQHVGVGSASRRADRASHLGSSGCNSRRQEWRRLGSVFRGSADCCQYAPTGRLENKAPGAGDVCHHHSSPGDPPDAIICKECFIIGRWPVFDLLAIGH